MLILTSKKSELIKSGLGVDVTVLGFRRTQVLLAFDEPGKQRQVLNCRLDECFESEQGVAIHLLGIRGKQAKLGFDAPRDCWIHREKVFQRCEKVARGLQIYSAAINGRCEQCASRSFDEAKQLFTDMFGYTGHVQKLPANVASYDVLLEATLNSDHFPRLLTDKELAHGS